MKIDKRDPADWLLLMGFLFQAAMGLIRRMFMRGRPNRVVVLYGHKLNGNLLALHRKLDSSAGYGLRPVFLSMDGAYLQELRRDGIECCHAALPACASLLADAKAIVSSHGLHSLGLLLGPYRKLGLRFYDVWHGIPYKGFDADDFRLQRRYDETWVASDLCRALYVDKFGFDAPRVVATGYARTDRLVQPSEEQGALRASLGLPTEGRLILFAPTWKQDAAGRSLYPFGCAEREFLDALAGVAQRHGAGVILRSHLNSGDVARRSHSNVHALPGSRYPDAEGILLISDMLVCDWSSIAFDYLLVDRPTFFLDVEPPFRKGFSLGPEYRFGEVVSCLEGLLASLERTLINSETYWQLHAASHQKVKRQVYGHLADGNSAHRCIRRLMTSSL